MKTIIQLTQDHAMFSDLWRFHKEFSSREVDHSYWNDLVKDSEDLYKKYKSELCKNLIKEIVEELSKSNN